jgi:hypothetical protein
MSGNTSRQQVKIWKVLDHPRLPDNNVGRIVWVFLLGDSPDKRYPQKNSTRFCLGIALPDGSILSAHVGRPDSGLLQEHFRSTIESMMIIMGSVGILAVRTARTAAALCPPDSPLLLPRAGKKAGKLFKMNKNKKSIHVTSNVPVSKRG